MHTFDEFIAASPEVQHATTRDYILSLLAEAYIDPVRAEHGDLVLIVVPALHNRDDGTNDNEPLDQIDLYRVAALSAGSADPQIDASYLARELERDLNQRRLSGRVFVKLDDVVGAVIQAFYQRAIAHELLVVDERVVLLMPIFR